MYYEKVHVTGNCVWLKRGTMTVMISEWSCEKSSSIKYRFVQRHGAQSRDCQGLRRPVLAVSVCRVLAAFLHTCLPLIQNSPPACDRGPSCPEYLAWSLDVKDLLHLSRHHSLTPFLCHPTGTKGNFIVFAVHSLPSPAVVPLLTLWPSPSLSPFPTPRIYVC